MADNTTVVWTEDKLAYALDYTALGGIESVAASGYAIEQLYCEVGFAIPMTRNTPPLSVMLKYGDRVTKGGKALTPGGEVSCKNLSYALLDRAGLLWWIDIYENGDSNKVETSYNYIGTPMGSASPNWTLCQYWIGAVRFMKDLTEEKMNQMAQSYVMGPDEPFKVLLRSDILAELDRLFPQNV